MNLETVSLKSYIMDMDMGDISMLVLVLIWLGGIYWALFTDIY